MADSPAKSRDETSGAEVEIWGLAARLALFDWAVTNLRNATRFAAGYVPQSRKDVLSVTWFDGFVNPGPYARDVLPKSSVRQLSVLAVGGVLAMTGSALADALPSFPGAVLKGLLLTAGLCPFLAAGLWLGLMAGWRWWARQRSASVPEAGAVLRWVLWMASPFVLFGGSGLILTGVFHLGAATTYDMAAFGWAWIFGAAGAQVLGLPARWAWGVSWTLTTGGLVLWVAWVGWLLRLFGG